jgi:hypothetical protein
MTFLKQTRSLYNGMYLAVINIQSSVMEQLISTEDDLGQQYDVKTDYETIKISKIIWNWIFLNITILLNTVSVFWNQRSSFE